MGTQAPGIDRPEPGDLEVGDGLRHLALQAGGRLPIGGTHLLDADLAMGCHQDPRSRQPDRDHTTIHGLDTRMNWRFRTNGILEMTHGKRWRRMGPI